MPSPLRRRWLESLPAPLERHARALAAAAARERGTAAEAWLLHGAVLAALKARSARAHGGFNDEASARSVLADVGPDVASLVAGAGAPALEASGRTVGLVLSEATGALAPPRASDLDFLRRVAAVLIAPVCDA